MANFKLQAKIEKLLQEYPEKEFTSRQIAEWIFKKYPEDCYQKREESKAKKCPLDSDKALVQQILSEITRCYSRLQQKKRGFKTTEGYPRKFYFTQYSDAEEVDHAENAKDSPASKTDGSFVKEEELYPILAEFLLPGLGVYSKRIDEKRSRNSQGAGGNKWLHPDLVGMEDLSGDWDHEIKECVKQYADKRAKLWSFEVKPQIDNRSKAREAFLQAVTNSSWANFGYLVAGEISHKDAREELRMLASRHGIGFIKLEVEHPSKSQILIPAKERNAIDWDTANRLATENEDFKQYVKIVRQFCQTGEIHLSDWMDIASQ